MKMYIDIFKPEIINKIHPAPSWRLLEKYGGFMTVEQFRKSFNEYISIDKNYNVTNLPKIHPIGKVFEEHFIF